MDRPFRGEHEDGSFIPMSNRTSAPNRDYNSAFRELLLDGEAKASSSDSSDSDSELDDDQADTVTGLSADQEAMKLLEAKLSDDPSSLASWHAVLSHSLATIPPDSRNARKARGEITLSVFGRALAASESNGTSARLRALYLQAGESVWTADKLEAEWESALRTVKNKAQIYLAWLNWRLQVRMRQGDLAGVADDVGRAFRTLENHDSEITRVGILLRCARFFKEAGGCAAVSFIEHVAHETAGYPERGVALFQAQVELYVVFLLHHTNRSCFTEPTLLPKCCAPTLYQRNYPSWNNFGTQRSRVSARKARRAGQPGWSCHQIRTLTRMVTNQLHL